MTTPGPEVHSSSQMHTGDSLTLSKPPEQQDNGSLCLKHSVLLQQQPLDNDVTARTYYSFLTGGRTGVPGSPRATWPEHMHTGVGAGTVLNSSCLCHPTPSASHEWTSSDLFSMNSKVHGSISSLAHHPASSFVSPSILTEEGAPHL